MKGFIELNLRRMLERRGEDDSKSLLSSFSCPLNSDVQDFLHYKAIEFSKQNLATTFLVFASYKQTPVLVGYYTLANKQIAISDNLRLGKTMKRKLNKFSNPPMYEGAPRVISAPLLAQLGKNYTNGYNKLIRGDELLDLACNRLKGILDQLSGKIVYVECEKTFKLVEFYERNGFISFDERPKSREEKAIYANDYLVQLLRYF